MRILHRSLIFALVSAAVLAGCASNQRAIFQPGEGPEAVYEYGAAAMADGNFREALLYFQALQARFPFSNVTRQAQLDMIYAYYRNRERESAIDAAEAFERENPTHPRVDYALYMRGLAHFDEAPGWIERMFKVDMTERPPRESMQAFSVFQELLRRFPESQYAPDARERMIFLRNRLAAYENHVAEYYMERQAYVAAINRAKYVVETYPGAPDTERALEIMVEAYETLGMTDLANDARRVLSETRGELAAVQ
ncbi:MAG: outer membrane protein assembly factor BamD [Gammaproteobacteria bacterium]|nr:outer membrane protein assembly factor BamD [Gammaproteobacteria bacterium]MDH3508237.1 outer membrane protein assembly factor BamD [Gammaproteobacteria bacterium]